MKINNGLSLARDESGFLLLALDGKIIPGQTSVKVEDDTTPNSTQRCLSVTVMFEVFEDFGETDFSSPETAKLIAETAKYSGGLRWYEIVAVVATTLAAVAIAKLFI